MCTVCTCNWEKKTVSNTKKKFKVSELKWRPNYKLKDLFLHSLNRKMTLFVWTFPPNLVALKINVNYFENIKRPVYKGINQPSILVFCMKDETLWTDGGNGSDWWWAMNLCHQTLCYHLYHNHLPPSAEKHYNIWAVFSEF